MAASVRTALLLLPLVSVVLAMAVRCLCRVAARNAQLVRRLAPSGGSPSFRYCLSVVEKGGELPVYNYRRSCGGVDDVEECALCLSGIEEGSEVRELRCRHLFHRSCLDRWLLLPAATCPLCRRRLLSAEEEEDEDSDMTLFMACVHSRSSWLWPS